MNEQIDFLNSNKKKSIKDTINWFEANKGKIKDLSLFQKNSYLIKGRFYKLQYQSVSKHSFSDLRPLVLSLGQVEFKNGKFDSCLNLNYFPHDIKIYIIKTLYKDYKLTIDTINRNFYKNSPNIGYINIDYDILKDLFPKINLQFGIRNYGLANRGNVYNISFNNIYKIPFLNNFGFIKMSKEQIMDLHMKDLKNKIVDDPNNEPNK